MYQSRAQAQKDPNADRCKEKWGDSRYYEMTLNTSKIGYENAAEVIDFYIRKRME